MLNKIQSKVFVSVVLFVVCGLMVVSMGCLADFRFTAAAGEDACKAVVQQNANGQWWCPEHGEVGKYHTITNANVELGSPNPARD